MTGAERFAELLVAIDEMYPQGEDDEIVDLTIARMNAVACSTLELAADLQQQHDYGSAHDVIELGARTARALAAAVTHMPEFRDRADRYFATVQPVAVAADAQPPAWVAEVLGMAPPKKS